MSAGRRIALAKHIIQPRIDRIFTNGKRLRRRFSLLVLFVFIRGIRGSRTSGQDERTAGFGKIMDSKIIFLEGGGALSRESCSAGRRIALAKHIFQPRIDRIFTDGKRLRWRFSLLVLFVSIRSIRGSRTSGQDERTAGFGKIMDSKIIFFGGRRRAVARVL
jgi:hypothetical protein